MGFWLSLSLILSLSLSLLSLAGCPLVNAREVILFHYIADACNILLGALFFLFFLFFILFLPFRRAKDLGRLPCCLLCRGGVER